MAKKPCFRGPLNKEHGKSVETGPLQYLLISVKVVALEEDSFSDTQNPKTVC